MMAQHFHGLRSHFRLHMRNYCLLQQLLTAFLIMRNLEHKMQFFFIMRDLEHPGDKYFIRLIIL